MPKHHRYGDPRKRQPHIEQVGHHAHTYLITYDVYVRTNRGYSIVSEYLIVHSIQDVANAYGWIYQQQEQSRPETFAELPMPRVFPVDGAIRELPESGYDL